MKIILAEEPFLSIQGEGVSVGVPSVFVRFFGCNLRCEWCDSKYAVSDRESICEYTLDSLINKIISFNCTNVVFTGGEPSLFEGIITDIINALPNFTYEIETNGSKPLRNWYDRINCSPKLSNSGNEEYELMVPPALNVIYKFVAKTRDDCYEIQEFIEEHNLKMGNNIFIMPEGVDNESQHNGDVLQFCLTYGYRYCLRQHILLFGDNKGC